MEKLSENYNWLNNPPVIVPASGVMPPWIKVSSGIIRTHSFLGEYNPQSLGHEHFNSTGI